MAKLIRLDNLNTARFVTFSCYHHYNLLKTKASLSIAVDKLNTVRAKYKFKLYGYVFMPDHVHLILLPPENIELGKIIGEFKSRAAREIIKMWQNRKMNIFDRLKIHKDGKQRFVFWQRRYYDHNCRTKETVIEKINYCHNNPVKKGLVDEAGDWPWSSYRWYNAMDGVEIEIDDFE